MVLQIASRCAARTAAMASHGTSEPTAGRRHANGCAAADAEFDGWLHRILSPAWAISYGGFEHAAEKPLAG